MHELPVLFDAMNLKDVDHRLRELLATIPPPFRSAMLAVLEARDSDDRSRAIGDFTRTAGAPALRRGARLSVLRRNGSAAVANERAHDADWLPSFLGIFSGISTSVT